MLTAGGPACTLAGWLAAGWVCKQDSVSSPGPHKEVAHILHRFHFSSLLKRMSTVVRVESAADAGAKERWA